MAEFWEFQTVYTQKSEKVGDVYMFDSECERFDLLVRTMYAEYKAEFLKSKLAVYDIADFKSGKVPRPLSFHDWYGSEFFLILDQWEKTKWGEYGY